MKIKSLIAVLLMAGTLAMGQKVKSKAEVVQIGAMSASQDPTTGIWTHTPPSIEQVRSGFAKWHPFLANYPRARKAARRRSPLSLRHSAGWPFREKLKRPGLRLTQPGRKSHPHCRRPRR